MRTGSTTLRTLLLALIVATAAGCKDGDVQADLADGVAVRGVVTDASSDKKLAGVKVTFTSDTLDTADDVTDGEGRFTLTVFSRTPKGRLVAKKSGYKSSTVSVYLDAPVVAADLTLVKE